MKLNPDIIRDILLSVEDISDFDTVTIYRRDQMSLPRLEKYSHEEIKYHILQCEKFELIYQVEYTDGGSNIYIRDLTPAGHEFLANIRNDTFFNKIKDVAKDIGVSSLKDLTQIASASAMVLIKSHFNL